VRFAGYVVPNRVGQITICEVSVAALLALAGAPNLSESELMGVFELNRETIFAAASAQFDAGNVRPSVDVKDLTRTLA
jgi:hypothetical protein